MGGAGNARSSAREGAGPRGGVGDVCVVREIGGRFTGEGRAQGMSDDKTGETSV